MATTSQRASWSRWLAWAGGFVRAGAAPAAVADTNPPLCRISLVRVDGRIFPGPSATNAAPAKTLTLSPHPGRVDFNFGPVDSALDRPLRLRYKLEGWDPGWREAGGKMDLLVIAEAASNHVLSYHRIGIVGESTGGPVGVRNPACGNRPA
jgi:hypothetical protein